MFPPDFSQIWLFSTRIHKKSPQNQTVWKSVQLEPRRYTRKEGRTYGHDEANWRFSRLSNAPKMSYTLVVFINEQRNSSFSNSNEVNRRSELRNKQSQFEKYIFRMLQIPFHKMSASIFIQNLRLNESSRLWNCSSVHRKQSDLLQIGLF